MKKITYLLNCLIGFCAFSQENIIIDYTFEDSDSHICNSSLYIVNNESIFKLHDERESGIDEKKSREDYWVVVNNDKTSKLIYSTERKAITRIPLYKKEIIYSTDNSSMNYELTGNNKKIDIYNCQEAKLSLNGRKYIIWFTPEVPVNFGPYKINGLPGLVMEVIEETNKVKIAFKSLKKLTNTDDFDSYKKYILSKPVLEYTNYEKVIIDLMTAKKNKQIASYTEMGAKIQYAKGQVSFTTFLIDIPTNLVSELEKITQ